jgi:hypothetical protein
VTPGIGFYRASVAFSFAHSTLLAGYGGIVGYSGCDLKAVGMIVWQGGNRSDRASHRT